MKTIQIAPYKEDCTVTEKRITGTMGGRKFIYEIPDNVAVTFDLDCRDWFIKCFCEAIAICSKQWQVNDLLNGHFGIDFGRFYEE